MKVIAKPIEVISWFTDEGVPNPFKFRIREGDKWRVVKIEQVVDKYIENLAGNKMYVFICQSKIKGQLQKFEIKFELESCRWMLFKI